MASLRKPQRGFYNTATHMSEKQKHYKKVHDWVKARRGKANFCRIDARHKSRGYDWANISRKYYLKDKDWIPLCKSCHQLFDRNNLSIEELKIKIKERQELIKEVLNGEFTKKNQDPILLKYQRLIFAHSLEKIS